MGISFLIQVLAQKQTSEPYKMPKKRKNHFNVLKAYVQYLPPSTEVGQGQKQYTFWYLSLSVTLNNKLKVKYLLFVLGLWTILPDSEAAGARMWLKCDLFE